MSRGGKLHDMTRDQEVFETPDPIDTMENYDDDQKSEVVHKLAMNVQSSYDKFKDKVLDGKNTDFSGRVDIPDRHGYRAEPSDYEMSVVDREPETLLQRYQRLKGEVTELVSDVEKVKESQESSEKLLQVSPADLLQDVQLLQKQLHGLQLDRSLGSQLMLSAEHPYHTILLRDLKAQLEALKEGQSVEGGGGGRGGKQPPQGSKDQLPTYEIYARTESAKFAHLSKLSEVEQRLSQLEALVGTQDTTVSAVAGGLDGDQRDLSSAVLNLQAKVALLDPSHISAIGGQLQNVLQLLEQVSEQAEKKEASPDKKTQVSEALDVVGRVSSVAPLIPELVARLHALRELHERASQFAGSVAYMSDSQHQVSKQVTELQKLLTKVQSSVQENLTSLQSEFSGLESRMAKLQTNKS